MGFASDGVKCHRRTFPLAAFLGLEREDGVHAFTHLASLPKCVFPPVDNWAGQLGCGVCEATSCFSSVYREAAVRSSPALAGGGATFLFFMLILFRPRTSRFEPRLEPGSEGRVKHFHFVLEPT